METGTLVAIVSMVASVLSAFTTVALALLTSRYVKLTNALVEEERSSKIPAVYVDLELDAFDPKFVIGNAGNSPALNIKIDVLRDTEWTPVAATSPAGLAALSPIKQGIGYLAPGRALKFMPGMIDDRAKFFDRDSRIELKISYETEGGRHVDREIAFDLSSYSGVLLESFKDPERAVADAIRDTARDQQNREAFRSPLRRFSTKPCFMCAERIAISARKCRYCMEPQPENEGYQ